MKLKLSRVAENDLENIALFIARDNARRAWSFVRDIRMQCARLSKQPELYPQRPEVHQGMRSCAFGRYVIFFSVDEPGNRILIHRILYSAMDIGKHLPAGSTPSMLSQDMASYL